MGVGIAYSSVLPQSTRTGVISGTVTAASGTPAVGHRVIAVVPHSYALHARTETGAAGAYTLPHLDKSSRYHVIFEDYDGGTQYDYLIHSNVTPG